MSDNDEIYKKGILDNFQDGHKWEYPNKPGEPSIVRNDWEPPEEPELTYYEEHVLRLLDGIYDLLYVLVGK